MKKITVDNYEAWFLDYIEGRLDAEMIHELESFLLLYPHLKEELEQATMVQLTPENLSFVHKDDLKKFQFENQCITTATFNDFCIASYEGLLTEKKKEELSNFMQTDPVFFRDYIAYGKAILKPDDIVFSSKNKLYREVSNTKRRTIFIWTSAAAAVALLMGLYIGFIRSKDEQHIPIAVHLSSQKTEIKPNANALAKEVVTAKSFVKKKTSHGTKTITQAETETISEESQEQESSIETDIVQPTEVPVIASIESSNDGNTDTVSGSTEQIIEQAATNSNEGEKRKLLALMEEGVEKINKVTKSDNLALAHQTTSTGEIKSFRIKLGFIGFERKKARND